MKTVLLLFVFALVVIQLPNEGNAVCCPGKGYLWARKCNDCSKATPYCSREGKCNIFGCNCDGGCKTGPCKHHGHGQHPMKPQEPVPYGGGTYGSYKPETPYYSESASTYDSMPQSGYDTDSQVPEEPAEVQVPEETVYSQVSEEPEVQVPEETVDSEIYEEPAEVQVPEETVDTSVQDNMESGKESENMESVQESENMESGQETENMEFGQESENMGSGQETENMEFGQESENMGSGQETENMEFGQESENMGSGQETENMEFGQESENMGSGQETENMEFGQKSEDMESMDMFGQESENIESQTEDSSYSYGEGMEQEQVQEQSRFKREISTPEDLIRAADMNGDGLMDMDEAEKYLIKRGLAPYYGNRVKRSLLDYDRNNDNFISADEIEPSEDK